jgi:hypothetical protein
MILGSQSYGGNIIESSNISIKKKDALGYPWHILGWFHHLIKFSVKF